PLLEMLRDPGKARVIFYVALVGGLLVALKLSRRLAIIAIATIAFGFVVHAIAGAIDGSWTAGDKAGGGSGDIAHWVVVPAHTAHWVAPGAYLELIAMA